jgi:D-3-phosphoglycerate dehydrogenase
MTLKILITDKVIDYLLKLLDDKGFKYDYKPDITHEELLKIVRDYNVLIVRGRTKVSKDILKEGTNLKAIIRFGVGLDNIDLESAKEQGVKDFNTPKAFTEAAAELTLALMLGISRNLGQAHYSLKNGKWEKKKLYGNELLNKKIAIVGFGRIGRRVAELLKPFNVNIVVYDVIKFPKDILDKHGAVQVESIEDAVKDADVITLHVPIMPETKDMFNIELFRKLEKKPFLINTSRGGVIKYDDLLKALDEGLIKGCALDVYPYEPFDDKRLLNRENVFLTPHIGAQTYEANIRAAEEVIRILDELAS